jgi:hypothetical protein
MPKKSPKLGVFDIKITTEGDLWTISVDVPCGFLMIFLAKQY